MAEKVWTAEQLEAIRARNWSVLVSAAAGSGKTAVLVERIVRLVMEGTKISRMLIVTFTRAAAGEMRERLNQRLSALLREEDVPREMREIFAGALEELPSAQISTIHAFCQHVLAREFQLVGIDPEARVADTSKRQELFDQAFREAANALLEEGEDPDFRLLLDCFTVEEAQKMTDSLHTFLMSLSRPWDWLDSACALPAAPLDAEHPWVKALLGAVERQARELTARAALEAQMCLEADAVPAYFPAVEDDGRLAGQIADAEDVFAAVRTAADCAPARLSQARKLTERQKAWKERFDAAREAFKKALKGIQAWARFDVEREREDLDRLAACLRGLRALTRRTEDRFAALKREKSLIDFSDMEQLTLRILEDPGARERCRQEFDELFVDECQDVSESQDAIIRAIHGEENRLFLVGDVKQSIYRFRRADPTIFIRRMQTWDDAADARERRIFLTVNFRSRPAVLQAANEVFQRAMQRRVTELDYQEQDRLIPCMDTSGDPPAEVLLCDDEETGAKPLDCEAAQAARLIREMVGKPYTSFKGEEGILRYRDICILMREVSNSGDAVRDALAAAGIPVYFDSGEGYANLLEVRAMTDMLEVIDNPLQDLPLISTLRSDWFGFSDEELAEIRLCAPDRDRPFHEAFQVCAAGEGALAERCREAAESLSRWRVRCEHSRLSDFIWALMHESGFYAAEGALPGGEERMANLRMLYSQAQLFEQAGGAALGDFLRANRQRSDAGDARSAKLLGEHEDLVRVMTMHKSKGLEFPVVICLRLSKGRSGQSNGKLALHPLLGACLPVVRREQHLFRNCFAGELLDGQRARDEMAELCRLLYVAMTRAKERLILTGCVSEISREAIALPAGEVRVGAARSMMDWILQAVCDLKGSPALEDADAAPFRLRLCPPEQTEEARQGAVSDGCWLTALETALPTRPPLWTEEEARPRVLPQKLSVTALAHYLNEPGPLPIPDAEETPEVKAGAQGEETAALLGDLPERPRFLMEERELTAAERGTVTHRFLSLTPLERLRGLEGEALRSVLAETLEENAALGVFTREEAGCVSVEAAAAFYESGLGRRTLAAGSVRRELSFNLALPERGSILQGIIDLCFQEEGGWILVDYKTDRITGIPAFVDRHRRQLHWYARALTLITGLPVKEQWLFALSIGKAVRVGQDPG